MSEDEIGSIMGWSGPGAYHHRHMKKIKRIVDEARRRERERCAAGGGSCEFRVVLEEPYDVSVVAGDASSL